MATLKPVCPWVLFTNVYALNSIPINVLRLLFITMLKVFLAQWTIVTMDLVGPQQSICPILPEFQVRAQPVSYLHFIQEWAQAMTEVNTLGLDQLA